MVKLHFQSPAVPDLKAVHELLSQILRFSHILFPGPWRLNTSKQRWQGKEAKKYERLRNMQEKTTEENNYEEKIFFCIGTQFQANMALKEERK